MRRPPPGRPGGHRAGRLPGAALPGLLCRHGRPGRARPDHPRRRLGAATCFAAGALAWLVRRARGGNADDGGAAFALAALGLLLLAVRVAAAHPWPAVAPAVMTGGALAQAVVLGLLVTALVTVGPRQRGRAVPDGARESAQR
ncbi:hypothetical protein ABT382_33075 [Streptomyces pharetrae]|uniref:hypothetical protein n=1 Tax=Streptomyces pharetrae TaxID=291370 RepID=UPI00335CEA7B